MGIVTYRFAYDTTAAKPALLRFTAPAREPVSFGNFALQGKLDAAGENILFTLTAEANVR